MGQYNIICFNVNLEGGVYGANETRPGLPESQKAELWQSMGTWVVAILADLLATGWIGAWCCFVRWRNCFSISSAFPLSAYAA